MCTRIYCSDPAYPKFWLNYLPNEEEIETIEISHILIKIYWYTKTNASNSIHLEK